MRLDPFDFIPHLASRVIGLGGDDTSDANYAFHTHYVSCEPGPVTFTIRFANLHASVGNLTVRINAISSAPGAVARTVKMTSHSLHDLADVGELQISVEAKGHLTYSVLGLIYGVSDASADALDILLDRPGDGSIGEDPAIAAKYTQFGRDITRDVSRLVAGTAATLADPVSQICTAEQFDEPDYDRWLATLKAGKQVHRKQWEQVYILRTLERYGMLEPGARGLGLGVKGEPVAAVLAAKGCSVVATSFPAERHADEAMDHEGVMAALRHPSLCPARTFDDAVVYLPADGDTLPDELQDFDFCWSAGGPERFASVGESVRFLLDSLQCLKVGGLAVHTVAFDTSSELGMVEEKGAMLRRIDLERLALELVSMGHQIAQLKYDQGEPLALVTSVGLIIRKGESNFY